ncbi:CLUMA_CG019719, isoform A [Clunio marinus]|uniref:CLUMA_CG019719, isoform A n=1 Tax=Clunio marinus TaxID=568069 RepID=A0A1J1J3I3_9DIPT|nr:CLUMA_CG019719, isoform A [Clunio marinus]
MSLLVVFQDDLKLSHPPVTLRSTKVCHEMTLTKRLRQFFRLSGKLQVKANIQNMSLLNVNDFSRQYKQTENKLIMSHFSYFV